MRTDDVEELGDVLLERLTRPEFVNLARNVMQLTIALSLLDTLSKTVPNRPSDLYDAYMSLFVAREGRKTPVVAEYRDWLIAFHGKIAYELHQRAEHGRMGAIARSELRDRALTFLREEQLDTTVVDQFFNGVVDRIMVLVERVDGFFEFEVQPLREYFAAAHLYDTADDGHNGPSCETVPDRCARLLRSPFWANVLRFFVGRFRAGELATLADELMDFAEDPKWGATVTPRDMAVALLSDQALTRDKPRRRVVGNA